MSGEGCGVLGAPYQDDEGTEFVKRTADDELFIQIDMFEWLPKIK